MNAVFLPTVAALLMQIALGMAVFLPIDTASRISASCLLSLTIDLLAGSFVVAFRRPTAPRLIDRNSRRLSRRCDYPLVLNLLASVGCVSVIGAGEPAFRHSRVVGVCLRSARGRAVSNPSSSTA